MRKWIPKDEGLIRDVCVIQAKGPRPRLLKLELQEKTVKMNTQPRPGLE